MTILKAEQQQEVADLITEIERHTDAEFVAVLARRSDNYNYIPLLWSAVIALLMPFLLLALPLWLGAFDIAVAQLIVFLVLSLLFRIPAIGIHLIPKSVRFGRAANMARRQFLENNLHHTRGETGVLLFISEAEHYVEIIADRGINQLVEQRQWQQLIDDFVGAVKGGHTHSGLIACISGCGTILRDKVPATSDRNELPNGLVILP
jgi:putative membrane protein